MSVRQPKADGPRALLAAGVARARLRPRTTASREPRWWEGNPGSVQSAAGRSAPPPPPTPVSVAARTAEPESPAPLSGMCPPAALTMATAACLVAPALVFLDAPPWALFPAIALLLGLAPGTALLRLVQPLRGRIEIGLAVGVSVAVTAVAAQCALWTGAWNPELFIYVLAGICLACMVSAWLWQLGRRRTRARRPERQPGPVPAPLDAYRRTPDQSRDAAVASVVVRADGDPAALALALRALDRGPAARRFTSEYKLRILREAEACTRKSEVTALLRREGLCASHLTTWRQKRDEGALAPLDRPPGREPRDPWADVSGPAGELPEPTGAGRGSRP